MIYIYCASVVFSVVVLLTAVYYVVADRYSYCNYIEVTYEDAIVVAMCIMVSFVPFLNVAVAGVAGGVVACEMYTGDGVLLTIKKCKQSPAQHQSSCHVCKNFH